MATEYEIWRINGPHGPAVLFDLGEMRREEAERWADKQMRKRRWFAVGVRPRSRTVGPWSYLNTLDPDPEPIDVPPPPALQPLPMRDNPAVSRRPTA